MSRTRKIVIAGISALVVVLVVVVLVVVRQVGIDQRRAACDQWAPGSADRYLCLDLADD